MCYHWKKGEGVHPQAFHTDGITDSVRKRQNVERQLQIITEHSHLRVSETHTGMAQSRMLQYSYNSTMHGCGSHTHTGLENICPLYPFIPVHVFHLKGYERRTTCESNCLWAAISTAVLLDCYLVAVCVSTFLTFVCLTYQR